jgi:hypothetical protein
MVIVPFVGRVHARMVYRSAARALPRCSSSFKTALVQDSARSRQRSFKTALVHRQAGIIKSIANVVGLVSIPGASSKARNSRPANSQVRLSLDRRPRCSRSIAYRLIVGSFESRLQKPWTRAAQIRASTARGRAHCGWHHNQAADLGTTTVEMLRAHREFLCLSPWCPASASRHLNQ